MVGTNRKLSATGGPRPARWAWAAVALLICGFVLGFYGWIVQPAISQLGNATARTAHYNLLTDGFLAGQLHLKKEAAPELARLKNPYDPEQNAPYRLHDGSYFRGKLYLYFGVTPTLTLFMPYTLLTGRYLWHNEAVAIFAGAGFLVSVGLVAAVRRRYFPNIGGGVMALAVAVLGLANGVPVLLRRPDVWEVPIMAASLLVLLALAALWAALHARRGRMFWLAAASAAYGLALGARPSVLPGAAMLMVPVLLAWRETGRLDRKLLAAAVVPITAAGLALLAFNYARFGNLAEFGQNYQMAGDNQNALRHFGLDFIPYNLRVYFWEPMRWIWYFPFVTGIEIPPAPPGQFGVENPFGVLTNVPVVWFALGAALVGWRWRAAGERGLRGWLAAAALVFALCALFIACFGGACNRYEVEFLVVLVVLAVVGIFAVERALAARSAWRALARAGWIAAAIFSVGFNFFASCENWGLLRLRDPAGFSRLARFWNAPAAWLEARQGVQPGPLELTLVLPTFTESRFEPLLVTGLKDRADYVWIHYIDAGHVRFGFEHTSYGGPVSPLIPVDYARENTVLIELASLYPPPEHAFHRGIDEDEAARIGRVARIALNDREVLSGQVEAYDAAPETRWVGRNPYAQHFGAAFTGKILRQRTLVPVPEAQRRGPGAAHLKLWFPAGRPPGLQEPLVASGVTGAGDLIYVRYLDDRHVAFGFDHWGVGGIMSKPVEIDFRQAYQLTVKMGSLAPAPVPGKPALGKLEVTLDGAVVLAGEFEFHPARVEQVYFGANVIGGSTAGPKFSGRIVDLRRGD